MNESFSIQILAALIDGPENIDDFFFFELGFLFIDHLFEIASIAVLGDNVTVVNGRVYVEAL